MNKSFKKVISCLLAVLMVVCAFPFTALANTNVVGWWGDKEYDRAKNPNVPYGEQTIMSIYDHAYANGLTTEDIAEGDLNWGDGVDLTGDLGIEEDYIWDEVLANYKPNITITVSSQGNSKAGEFTKETKLKNKFYGYNASMTTQGVADNGGEILNPADLKAGQRIAVAIEIGGFDLLYTTQIKGMYDQNYLKAASYRVNTWKDITGEDDQAHAWLVKGASVYKQGQVWTDFGGYNIDPTVGQIVYPMCGVGSAKQSIYIPKDQREFGENGVLACVISFEVLQDCDLSDVLNLADDRDHADPIATTFVQPVSPDLLSSRHGKFSFDTVTNEAYTYGLIGVSYTNYQAAEAGDDTVTYNFVANDGREIDPITCPAGATPAEADMPATLTGSVEHNADSDPSTHTVTTYSWVLDGTTYTETESTSTVNCTFEDEVTADPTCGAAGKTTYTCTDCEYSYDDEELPAATGNHTWDYTKASNAEWTNFDSCTVKVPCKNCDATTSVASTSVTSNVTTTATCLVKGVKTYTAKFPNGIADVQTTENLDFGDHVAGAWAHVEGTEKENSKHARVCSVCHNDREEAACEFGTMQVIDPATETKTGTGRYTCQVKGCGYSYDVPIPMKDCAHAGLEAHPYKAPNCVTEGNSAYWYCPTCGKYFSNADCNVETTLDATVLAATGVHDYDYANVTAPVWTGYTACSVTATCKNCDATEVVNATNITNNVTTTATCLVKGVKTYTATFPNGIADTNITEDLGYGAHTPKKTAANAPTCTVDGNIEYWTCTTCDKIFSDEACTNEITDTVVPATGHNGVATAAKAATCVAAGNIAYWTCEDCGKTFSDADCKNEVTDVTTPVDPTNHNCVATEAKTATCVATGNIAYWTCEDCGKTFSDADCKNEVTDVTKPVDLTNHNGAPTELDPSTAVAPELDKEGKEADTICSACKKKVADGASINALKGYTLNVTAVDLGATTLNGEDATNGVVNKRVLANSAVTLEATSSEGAQFKGWEVNGKIVSEANPYTMTVVANTTVVPVFDTTSADEFTVIFADSYGNIIDTQTVGKGTDIVEPDAPARTGYVFGGWSKTEAEIDALTEGTTIIAKYDKDPSALFTVTATGCVITVNGTDYNNVAENVAYNTRVTVTKEGTDVWTINGADVAYGDTYSFYVGSTVEVVAVDDDTAIPMPTVANVSKTPIDGTTKYTYLATRSVPTGYTVVSCGFIYGKGVDTAEDAMVLDNVGSGYSALYNKTTAAQFSLSVGTKSTGTYIAVRAFVVCKDASGTVLEPVYAPVVTTNY